MKSQSKTHAGPTIQVSELYKSYRRGSSVTPVLRDLSFSVNRSECAFLVGPSGSGKSTLLSIVGCILSADQGSVRVLGEEVQALSRARRATVRLHRIGFVFQRFHLIRGLTAVENVSVPLGLIGAPQREARERAMHLLETFGLAEKSSCHPANLSTGQCQRIALARAIANDPELILADEPTASLDAENGRQVMELLRGLAKDHNRTVVIVTHDSRIFPYADRIHWLENGQLVKTTAAVSPEDGRAVNLLPGHEESIVMRGGSSAVPLG